MSLSVLLPWADSAWFVGHGRWTAATLPLLTIQPLSACDDVRRYPTPAHRNVGHPGRARELQWIRDLRRRARRAARSTGTRRHRVLSGAPHLLSRIRVPWHEADQAANHPLEASRHDHAHIPVVAARAWASLRYRAVFQRGQQ